MKFPLTSAGIGNPSISDALVDLLGKPIVESTALFIPTGAGGREAYRVAGRGLGCVGGGPRVW